MKKILAIMFIALFLLVACGPAKTAEKQPAEEQPQLGEVPPIPEEEPPGQSPYEQTSET